MMQLMQYPERPELNGVKLQHEHYPGKEKKLEYKNKKLSDIKSY